MSRHRSEFTVGGGNARNWCAPPKKGRSTIRLRNGTRIGCLPVDTEPLIDDWNLDRY